MLTGIRIAGELEEQGYDILATGEMGIGNTDDKQRCGRSPSGQDPVEEVTGKGAGLTSEGPAHAKIGV